MNEIDFILTSLGFQIRTSYDDGQTLIAADGALISGFEKEIGHELPADYRAFLLKYGGAFFPLDGDVVAEASSCDSRLAGELPLTLALFFGFYIPTSASDLFWEYRVHKNELLPGIVPIGLSHTDCLYCISCLEHSAGRIYLSTGKEFDDSDFEEYTFSVATSFIDFLRSLRRRSNAEVEKLRRATSPGP